MSNFVQPDKWQVFVYGILYVRTRPFRGVHTYIPYNRHVSKNPGSQTTMATRHIRSILRTIIDDMERNLRGDERQDDQATTPEPENDWKPETRTREESSGGP